jgi:uncharacterized protein (TIGR03437 family)
MPAVPAQAGVTLTGIKIMSADASGNVTPSAAHLWNTEGTSGNYKVWVIKGDDLEGAFLNGPTHLDAPLNIPMTGGTHTFTLFADGYSNLMTHYNLSLFFDLKTTPAINVFAPVNTSSTLFFPDWSANRGQVQEMGPNPKFVPSNGKLEYISGQTKITVTRWDWSGPQVFRNDRVDRFNARRSGGMDFIGHFTITVSAPPEISSGGVVNAASYMPRIAPGSLFTIFGTDLASATDAAAAIPLPPSLSGTSVTIGGRPAPLVYVSPTQINAQVPYELQEGSTAAVVVTVDGIASPQRTVQIAKAAPGLFTFGDKRAVVQNDNGSVNTGDNPARGGSYVVAYLTGGGNLDNAVATGAAAGSQPLSRPRANVTAKIGGAAAEVSFGGMTPGLVGLLQVNMKVPNLGAGTYPVVIAVDGVESNAAQMTIN